MARTLSTIPACLVGAALGMTACDKPPERDLQFENQADGYLFVNVDPPRKASIAHRGFLQIDADETIVRYGSADVAPLPGGRQQDTLAFIADPILAWEDSVVTELPTLTSPGVGVSWYRAGGCSNAPNSLPCPIKHASVALACTDFGPAAECSKGSVADETQAFFTYDRGACAKRIAVGGAVLQKLVDDATQTMHDQVADADPGMASTESHQHAGAQSAIWQAEHGVSAEGGFQVNLRMDVHTTGITWKPYPVVVNYDADANVSGRFRWALHDGLLGVDVLGTHTISANDDTDLYFFFNWDKPISSDLIDGLESDIPAAIKDAARLLQTVEIPNLSNEPVACRSADECADPTNAANASLVLGMSQSPLLGASERAALGSLIRQPSEWVCEKTCKMLVRGVRVNTYPDSVEIVFREAGAFPMVRESAVEAVLRATGDASDMCDPPTPGLKSIRGFQRKAKDRVYD
jgi:hypothetical protein